MAILGVLPALLQDAETVGRVPRKAYQAALQALQRMEDSQSQEALSRGEGYGRREGRILPGAFL